MPASTEPIESTSSISNSDRNRNRTLSGASALITRRFVKSNQEPVPTTSRSESTKRRATIDAATSENQRAHVRIVPSIENPSRSLIFDIVDRDIEVGEVLRIGRYSERHANINCMSFKSKVVSRCHCEVWVESDGKLYIRDTKSSSGTFLNHVRLSPAGNESRAVELHDGDIVQLGVDFQGGREEMYRSVKMKFEVNRTRKARPLSFSLNAFQNIRNLTHQQQQQSSSAERQTDEHQETTVDTSSSTPNTCSNDSPDNDTHKHHTASDLEECCICLYALAPFQALFVSPCSHTYHFKCIRPLLKSYPGFQCPICRTYSDLEASVETEDVLEKSENSNNSNLELPTNTDESIDLDQDQVESNPSLVSSPNIHSENLPDSPTLERGDSADVLNHVIEETSLSSNESSVSNEDELVDTSNQEEIQPDSSQAGNETTKRRERRSSQFMEKLKMVFFEKRKSSTSTPQQQAKQRRKSNRPRPLSYPNLLSMSDEEIPPVPTATRTGILSNVASTSSNFILSNTLSRQSTPTLANRHEGTNSSRRSLLMERMMIDT